jgi:hypothetical protein
MPGDDVQVSLVARARVAADEPGVGKLGEVLLDLGGGVLGPQDPQLAGDDRGVVPVAALVVRLGEQAEERAFGGQGHGCQGLGDESLGLDGADARQGRVVLSSWPVREATAGGCGGGPGSGSAVCGRPGWGGDIANIATPGARKSRPILRNL